MSAARTTTIVLGPLTRAGRVVAARATERGDDVFLVSRHDDDSATLSGGGGTVLRVDHDVDLLGAGNGPVRIVVCALGPVHPDEAQTAVDSQAVLRDLDFLGRLLAATAARPVSVVLISSIIAIAPGQDRRYYGGWKGLVEQQLRELVGRTSAQAAFSVVYPGRLVDPPARRLVPGLHTSYQHLAATVDRLAASGSSRARVSGVDARLWLVVNGLRVALHSILPLRASTPDRSLELPLSTSERYSRP